MAEDPTEEMVKREIAEAARILREDGFHIRKTVGGLFEEFQSGKTPEKTEPGEGDPPPKKEKTEPPARRGVWWGDRGND